MVPFTVQRKHRRTIKRIFDHPSGGNIAWQDIESLFMALGGHVTQRSGSRVAVVLFGEVRVFHRPHPQRETDKGAVASIRKWLRENGVNP